MQAYPNIRPWSPAPCSLCRPAPSVTPCEISGLCLLSETITAQFSKSKPIAGSVYPIFLIVSRTTVGISTTAFVVISPATTTNPVVTIVSQATLLFGSCASIASRIASDIWSATLSGWPIVTDSLVKRYLSVSQ